MASGEVEVAGALPATRERRRINAVEPLIFVVSIASALLFWELISRTGTISAKDLPAMSTSVRAL